jgi:Flagellar transcriptional activator (FlhC)
MEDRIGRELRRNQLATRMVSHKARTQTICDYTGLARERIKTLRGDLHVSSDQRHRGPSPSSVSVFFRSARIRCEASALAVMCRVLGAVGPEPIVDAARRYPNLERGERLCDVYEAFRTLFPASGVSFEQIVLLAINMAQGDVLQLQYCQGCDVAILADRLAAAQRLCSVCQLQNMAAAHR